MTVVTPPGRSMEQRLASLTKANHVRTHRAKLKIEMKGHRRSPVDVLASPEPEEDTMKVWDLLLAIPHVGRVKANKLIRVAGVSPHKTVGGLSQRQRRELIALMPRTRVHVVSHVGTAE